MNKNEWNIEESNKVYQISNWGEGYFEINSKGNLVVNPERESDGPKIDMLDVIKEMKDQNIEFPAVVRFHDILWAQVKNLNETFRDVIREEDYRGEYMGVYPIKVNQMREVVEEIVEAGSPYNFGLEAGSKPELCAVLAMNTNENSLTILNGYKDDEYMKLALLGKRIGRKVIVVIEKLSELDRLIRISREMNIEPYVGLRSKLTIKSKGKWQDSSGEKAKFGLSVAEMMMAVNKLRDEKLLSSLKLLHFHVGSQITDIKCIKDAVSEASRIYAKLFKIGAELEYIDVGGGLGIDYDGSKSTNNSSKNYNLKEYVTDVVWGIKNICNEENVPHPNIVSESGRAITAQHSCVISNVVDVIETNYESMNLEYQEHEHNLVKVAREHLDLLNEENYQEVYNDNVQMKYDAYNAFKLGILNIEEYSKIEGIIWEINKQIIKITKEIENVPDSLQNLEESMAPQYLCNFSVFQSAADHWAIDQVLPVVPLTRLNEEPSRRCKIVDITCDSDGKIKHFLDSGEIRKTLPLHAIKQGEEYFVGLFLTGAYQDVMGDMHNLFGKLNEVHVFQYDDDPTDFYIEEYIRGSSSEKVLSSMQYNPEQMAYMMKKRIDAKIKTGDIAPREAVRLTDFYEDSLKSYTYLNFEPSAH